MVKMFSFIVITSLLLAACAPRTIQPQSTSPTQNEVSTSAPQTNSLSISNFSFSPGSLTVKAGQNIIITNNDSVPHTVTSDDGKSFDTQSIDPGKSFSLVAPATPGTYGFHCKIHKTMTGNLVVK